MVVMTEPLPEPHGDTWSHIGATKHPPDNGNGLYRSLLIFRLNIRGNYVCIRLKGILRRSALPFARRHDLVAFDLESNDVC